MNKEKRLVFILAHPDDAEIWAGGTILNHIELGDKVKIIYLFANNEERKAEAISLCEMLAVKVEVLNSSDQVRSSLKEYKPDIIITHWDKDSHPEHRATYNVLSEMIPKIIIEDGLRFNLYACDTYNSIGATFNELFTPNVYVDITDKWGKKIELIENHKSQPIAYWIQMIYMQNRLYGARTKCGYAEAFLQINTLGYMYNTEKVLK